VDGTITEPLISGDTTGDFGDHAAIPISETRQERRPLIAKCDGRFEIVDGCGSNDARASQKPRGNPWNGIEPQKTQLADIDGPERHASQNLLSQQQRRCVPQLADALQRHAWPSAPKITGGS
jgi:hypothetical protein